MTTIAFTALGQITVMPDIRALSIEGMLMLGWAIAVLGLFVWALRSKKYAQALLAVVVLGASAAFLMGFVYLAEGKGLTGVSLVGIGLAALLGTAVASKPG